MNTTSDGPIDFKPDYEMLELDDQADWKTARANYRRLVHLWHPDRYAQRPRERPHAQRQFISLTKSYDNLRAFHRQNGHLPFEPFRQREQHEHVEQHTGSSGLPEDDSADAGVGTSVKSGILGEKSSRTRTIDRSMAKKFAWISSVVLLLCTTLMVFFVLDQRSNQKVIERARETIREAPGSEFMPSASEIRRSETRGAFVKP